MCNTEKERVILKQNGKEHTCFIEIPSVHYRKEGESSPQQEGAGLLEISQTEVGCEQKEPP